MTVSRNEIRRFTQWTGHYTEWYNTGWAKRSVHLWKKALHFTASKKFLDKQHRRWAQVAFIACKWRSLATLTANVKYSTLLAVSYFRQAQRDLSLTIWKSCFCPSGLRNKQINRSLYLYFTNCGVREFLVLHPSSINSTLHVDSKRRTAWLISKTIIKKKELLHACHNVQIDSNYACIWNVFGCDKYLLVRRVWYVWCVQSAVSAALFNVRPSRSVSR
jgi:hypothetical protein